ncbi:MAG TPA: hypothetical protein VLM16_01260 [Ginsengibacter sp.]|nr:hypothetical protein [Ginsengibacter sp.]
MKKKPLSKVIPLHEGHFANTVSRPLSKLMIASLVSACKKQLSGTPFGQPDIDGSFSALVSRGLIKYKNDNVVNGSVLPTWVVTDEAFEILHSLGIKIE